MSPLRTPKLDLPALRQRQRGVGVARPDPAEFELLFCPNGVHVGIMVQAQVQAGARGMDVRRLEPRQR